jgi:tetratricopeptide (TPR) repeat protein
MTGAPAKRAAAVRAAIAAASGVGYFREPLKQIERAAVEPLPGLADFLARWRALVEEEASAPRGFGWGADTHGWLREVVQRAEGAEGLAALARSTRRASDLRAWCRCLADARDWKGALSACEEAAELVATGDGSRGELLDAAALAAQELGRKDLAAWLERAWRGDPSMLRLRRWLGSASSRAAVRKRAAQALAACPKRAERQRAFLYVLLGELEPAAKLLAAAGGLGWSDGEHPGPLLFPLFHRMLGGTGPDPSSEFEADLDVIERLAVDQGEPRLAAPDVDQVLDLAGSARVACTRARGVVLEAMRKAAEKRVAGVTREKRRRRYDHAARLVAVCAALDPAPEAAAWLARVRDEFRRYPALRAALDQHLRSR